jgi:hypothetical protein
MRILFVIRVMVVPTMRGYPQGRRELQGERAEDGERVLEPKWDREAAMRYQAMEAEIDAKNAEREHSEDQKDDARPTEEPGKEGQHGKRMAENKSDQRVSLEFHLRAPRRLLPRAVGHPQPRWLHPDGHWVLST